MISFLLDPGHGGKDPGAIGNGLKEKDVNLIICKKIKELLKEYDCTVYLTRETDKFLSLEERTNMGNDLKVDALISIHVNASPSNSARGFESFIFPNSGIDTASFQNILHYEIVRAIGGQNVTTDRGKKTKNLHMVRESRMMAVLTENLFISNSADANLLKQEPFLDKIAKGHVNGLQKFFGLKRLDKVLTLPPNSRKVYKVQIGAFSTQDSARKLAKELTSKGYKTIIKYE